MPSLFVQIVLISLLHPHPPFTPPPRPSIYLYPSFSRPAVSPVSSHSHCRGIRSRVWHQALLGGKVKGLSGKSCDRVSLCMHSSVVFSRLKRWRVRVEINERKSSDLRRCNAERVVSVWPIVGATLGWTVSRTDEQNAFENIWFFNSNSRLHICVRKNLLKREVAVAPNEHFIQPNTLPHTGSSSEPDESSLSYSCSVLDEFRNYGKLFWGKLHQKVVFFFCCSSDLHFWLCSRPLKLKWSARLKQSVTPNWQKKKKKKTVCKKWSWNYWGYTYNLNPWHQSRFIKRALCCAWGQLFINV